MAAIETPVCNYNSKAPPFSLKGIDHKLWSLEKARLSNGLLVMFICNHCPYVKAIIDKLVSTCKELQSNKIGSIAIMPNDVNAYPEDSFEQMYLFSVEHNFSFPYVIDETQDVAKDYGAVCTPDFFGYNSDLELQYRGRFDNAGINAADQNTTEELKNAMLQIAKIGTGPKIQKPSIGCSIKWV